MNTQQKQVMQELIARTAYPDHYKQMEDRQQALSNGHQPRLLNLLDVLEQRDVRLKPKVWLIQST